MNAKFACLLAMYVRMQMTRSSGHPRPIVAYLSIYEPCLAPFVGLVCACSPTLPNPSPSELSAAALVATVSCVDYQSVSCVDHHAYVWHLAAMLFHLCQD